MTHNPFADVDAVAMADLVRRGEVSPVELTQAFLDTIEAADVELRAFVHVDPEAALARAAQVADEPMAGVPFAVKDVAGYPGMPWTMGSRLMAANVAGGHSPYTRAIDDAGFITLGKTATSELGLLGSTETLLHGPTANPCAAGVSAAGSSGGAAAAVAAGLLPVAHASDGGGSIRVPASVCGLFGFMPSNRRTHSTMPTRRGFTDLVIDHVVSTTVRDSARLLALTERRDDTAPYEPMGEVTTLPSRPLRIGTWSRALLGHRPDPEVAAVVSRTADLLVELGHHVEEVSPPAIEGSELSTAFFTFAGQSIADLAAMVTPMLGRDVGPGELEPFTLDLLDWFRSLPPDATDTATGTLRDATRAYMTTMDGIDVALTPTVATLPWSIGHLDPRLPREILLARTQEAVGFTPLHNIAGAPAMSVPLGSADGLPIGVQLAAAPGGDGVLLQLALQLEEVQPWRGPRPDVRPLGT